MYFFPQPASTWVLKFFCVSAKRRNQASVGQQREQVTTDRGLQFLILGSLPAVLVVELTGPNTQPPKSARGVAAGVWVQMQRSLS